VPWVVHGVPTVGAGDIFAAHLVADDALRHGASISVPIERAMRRVAEELDRRHTA
jgi:pyridoxal/pyridoxine/pyridoxamine kinase